MDKPDRCRLAPMGARADDWNSGDDDSYILPTLSSRRHRRQEHVYRPIRHRTRRQLNKFACLKCQLKKTKCDGSRPLCAACVKRHDEECEYPVREGAVSRYADLKVTSEQLEVENKCLKDLLSSLSSLPESDALAVYRKLRLADDPAAWTLQDVKHASVLFAATDSEALMIHADAPADSVLKVPAQPWTSVAGDALVSHLASDFFKWDNPFLCSFIDQELFLRDMRHGSRANSRFCSPFLVNSLCAWRSAFLNKAKFFQATTDNFGAKFTSEAKQHLDLEAGKLSLTTVQGLYILFMVSCLDGTNRAGAMYRLAALDFLSKLQADNSLARPGSEAPGHADQRQALSKACWGIFKVECIISDMFLKAPPILPPLIPSIQGGASNTAINTDILGSPFGLNSPQPPIAPGALAIANQISVLHYRVTRYNQEPRGLVGDEMDLRVRRDLYLQLTALENSSPAHLQHHNNPTPQTIHLKTHLNLIAHTLLRPLPPSAPFHPPTTTRSLLLTLCVQDLALLETYLARWPLAGQYSPMLISGVSTAVLTLLPLLLQKSSDDDGGGDKKNNVHDGDDIDGDDIGGRDVDSRVEALFTRACVLLREFAEQVTGVKRIMQGVLAVAWRNGWELPGPARVAFEGLASEEERERLTGGVAMDFMMPGLVGGVGVDLDRVLGEWGGAASGGGGSGL